ncbi:hypothetical protein FAY30_24150 [Bacillus sp. S3]|nr:hypothetical protein FAY30_24150 [Bacillus sp. S3]
MFLSIKLLLDTFLQTFSAERAPIKFYLYYDNLCDERMAAEPRKDDEKVLYEIGGEFYEWDWLNGENMKKVQSPQGFTARIVQVSDSHLA